MPKSASVVTPPVNILLANFGGLSLTSITSIMTFNVVSFVSSKKVSFAGTVLQSSVAFTISKCCSCRSLSKVLAVWNQYQ